MRAAVATKSQDAAAESPKPGACDHRNRSWWYSDGYTVCSCGEQLDPFQIDAVNSAGQGAEKYVHFRHAADPYGQLTLCEADEGSIRTTWQEELISCWECEKIYMGLALAGFLVYAARELVDLWPYIFEVDFFDDHL